MITKAILELFKDADLDSIPSRRLLLDYLESLATIEDDHLQKQLLGELIHRYVILEKRVDSLLKNTLPEAVSDIFMAASVDRCSKCAEKSEPAYRFSIF